MSDPTHCPQCNGEHIYQDGFIWICPECAHEWNPSIAQSADSATGSSSDGVIKDAYGNILQDGDSITLIKELRIKGSSSALKIGTKAKNIKLGDAGDGHNISCKIDGFGHINLKSEYVKKS